MNDFRALMDFIVWIRYSISLFSGCSMIILTLYMRHVCCINVKYSWILNTRIHSIGLNIPGHKQLSIIWRSCFKSIYYSPLWIIQEHSRGQSEIGATLSRGVGISNSSSWLSISFSISLSRVRFPVAIDAYFYFCVYLAIIGFSFLIENWKKEDFVNISQWSELTARNLKKFYVASKWSLSPLVRYQNYWIPYLSCLTLSIECPFISPGYSSCKTNLAFVKLN